MGKEGVTPEWHPKDDCEYTYKRERGDLIVFATSREDAIRTIEEHGFRVTDPARVIRTGRTLVEYLAAGELKKEEIK